MHALCGRLPALKTLILRGVKSLTPDGLRAVGGLTALTHLDLRFCLIVTDAVLRELRGLTALTRLYLGGCTDVTDVGLQHLFVAHSAHQALPRRHLHHQGGAEFAQGCPPRPHH